MQGGTGSVVGALTRALVFAPGGAVRLVGVRFRPGGAVPFLRVAADELTDTRCPCAELGAAHLIPPGLAEIDDVADAARRFEASLLAKATRLAPPDPRVQYALQAIFAPSPPAVDTLARRLGWTRQHLTRMIRAHVGVGPKTSRPDCPHAARCHVAAAAAARQCRRCSGRNGLLRSGAHGRRLPHTCRRRAAQRARCTRFHFSNPVPVLARMIRA